MSIGAAIALGVAGAAHAQENGFSGFVQSTHKGPVDITGRNFVYNYKTDTFIVRGDAVITQRHSVLTADEVEYERRLHLLHAKGHVHMVDPLGDMKGSAGTMNLADETADLTDGTITNKDESYLLKGKQDHQGHRPALPGQRRLLHDLRPRSRNARVEYYRR